MRSFPILLSTSVLALVACSSSNGSSGDATTATAAGGSSSTGGAASQGAGGSLGGASGGSGATSHGGASGGGVAAGGSPSGGATSTGGAGGSPASASDPSAALCGGAVFDAKGALNAQEYVKQARLWTRDAIDCRFGPTYASLHANDPDTRPDHAQPTTVDCGGDGTMKSHEYGGTGCDTGCASGKDFGSTEGPVLYVPDDMSDPGIDRVINYAYDGPLISIRPQPATGGSHPDPSLGNSHWPTLGFGDHHAFAAERTHVAWGNQAIALFDDGFVGALGTRTDGVPSESQFGFKFPPNIAPTAVAVTAMNEFVLVTVWDTDAHAGKLAVFAMQANSPSAHTWWYVGLPNAGGFWAGKFLGFVDLGIATPTSLAVATNGREISPNDTGQKPLGSYALITKDGCDPAVMKSFDHGGGLTNVVASRGYAIIGSRWENKVVFVDLEPLLAAFRHGYLEDVAYCNQYVAPVHQWNPNPSPTQFEGDDKWPFPFTTDLGKGSIPRVAATLDVTSPRGVAAGWVKYSWNHVVPRAYAITGDGKAVVMHPNRAYRRWTDDPAPDGLDMPAESDADPAIVSTFPICAHPTSIRMSSIDSAKIPASAFGSTDPKAADVPVETGNDLFRVVCRGERSIQQVAVAGDQSELHAILWELSDKELDDPVTFDQSERGPVITVADFHGKKLTGFQLGDIEGQGCSSNDYKVMGTAPAGQINATRGGSLVLPGTPFVFTTTNVN